MQNLQFPKQNLEPNQESISGHLITCEITKDILEEWLKVQVDHFQGTNLILLVLDVTYAWEKNFQLAEQIVHLRDFQCPQANIAIFFHKSDLLAKNEKDSFCERIKLTFESFPKLTAFLTSISPSYLLDTCHYFIMVLSNSFGYEHRSKASVLLKKISLLSLVLQQGHVKLQNIRDSVDMTPDQIISFISELESSRLFAINKTREEIHLGRLGQDLIQRIKEDISAKLYTSHPGELNYVDALILSDDAGRVFQIYERIPGFFDHISLKDTDAAIPDIISMFFSAVQGFYGLFDTPGLFEFHLKGRRMQIIWLRHEHMCAIFFLSVTPLVIDPSIRNVLQNFTRQYFMAIQPELLAMYSSQLAYTISTENTLFLQLLANLNNELRKIFALKNRILIDDIFALYGILPQIAATPTTRDTIRHLIYHYLLQEDPQLLKEIHLKE